MWTLGSGSKRNGDFKMNKMKFTLLVTWSFVMTDRETEVKKKHSCVVIHRIRTFEVKLLSFVSNPIMKKL